MYKAVIFLFLSVLLFPVLCFGKVEFSINDSITFGKEQMNNYLSLLLEYKPVSFSAGLYISQIKSSTDVVRAVDLGCVFELSKNISMNVGVSNYPETNNYRSNTFDLGINIRFPAVAKYLYTIIGAKYSATAHWHKIYRPRLRTWEWRALGQKSYTVSLSQDLPYNFYIHVDYSYYQYDQDVKLLTQQLERLMPYLRIGSLGTTAVLNIYGTVTSFPDKIYTLSIGNTITSCLDVSLSVSRVYYAVYADYMSSYVANVNLYLGKWIFSCGVSAQRLNENTDTISKYISLAAGYKF
jgi:hypothetical protein